MKGLVQIYSEQHSNGYENFIVNDIHTNKTYSLFYNKATNINIVFSSQDNLYQFNYVGKGIKRGYISDNDLDMLFSNMDKPFESYFEWIED